MTALRADKIPALIAAATAAVLIAQHVAGSAARDAFFLATYPASALPGATVASAVLSVAVLPLLSRMMARFGPAVVAPWTSALSALLLMAEWFVSFQWPGVTAVVLFLHTMVFSSVLVSGFWSLYNERFDPHTAKQLMGRVAGGAAFGGVIGGLLVKQAAAAGITLPLLLPMLAAAQLVATGGSIFLGRGSTRREKQPSPEPSPSFTSTLSGSPYMRGIALLMALIAFVSTLTSFVLKAQVRSTYTHGSDLLGFFAQYYLFLGLLGFLLQISLTRQFLNRFGLVVTLAMLPGAVCVFGLLGVLAPALWSMALLRGADEALTNSLFRSGYELLYIPIDPGTKRRFKAIVDLGCDRFGKTLGSGAVSLAIWMFAGNSLRVLLAVAVAGAMASLIVAVRLRPGYVEALTRSLKSQSVSLDAYALNDATTLCTIAVAGVGIDRDKVVAALRNPQQPGTRDAGMEFASGEAAMWGTQTMFVPSLKKEADTGAGARAAAQAMEPRDPLVSAIADLRSQDPHRVRTALLTNRPLDRHLVSHVISLLGRDDVHRDAARALRKVARTATGQLVDVLLDPVADPTVRRRLPHVLEACGSQIARDGLFRALDDPVFEVRFRSAGGLVRIREAHPDLVAARETIFEAAIREIRRSTQVETRGTGEGDARSLDLVFRILSLALEPEPLRLAQQAFRTDDAHLRGTALEYLETVLQESVLQELRPFVGASGRTPAVSRTEAELKSELLASSAAVSIDVASLRRKLRQDEPTT